MKQKSRRREYVKLRLAEKVVGALEVEKKKARKPDLRAKMELERKGKEMNVAQLQSM